MSVAGRWAQVTAVFHAALEREGVARIAYLDDVCADDRALRTEVESLLAAHQAAGDFAARSPFDALPVSAVAALSVDVADAAPISGAPALGATLTPGRRLGPYEIVGRIGLGGMGELFKARDTRLGRDVAIKVPRPAGVGDADSRQRFQREAHAIAALNHPHICTIYDVGFEAGIDYLVLELLHGESLAARLRRGPLPIDEALARAIELAGALDSAHRAGIVHRDFKPGNVMLTPAGAKVLDFGVARIRLGDAGASMAGAGGAAEPLTETGAVMGTLQYMAPEQLEGGVADARTDVYAFGATLVEMVTARRAFDPASSPGVPGASLHGEALSLLAARGDLPRSLERIVRTCLQKDPEARFASMHDVAIALQWVRDEARARAPSLPDSAGRPTRHAALMLAVVALVLGLGSVGWVLMTGPERRVQLQHARQVTFAVGAETQPVWSPDGGRIAYTAAGDIWIVHAAGGPTLNLTQDHPGVDRDPAWSPNASQIAFVSARDAGGVYVMPAIGGTSIRVSPAVAEGSAAEATFAAPQWSSDGLEVAYLRRESGSIVIEIVSLRTRESRRLQIPNDSGNRFDLSWSPDGRFFAYVRSPQRPEGISRVWVFRTSDQREIPITDGKWNDWSPTWSQDGRSLFYVSNRGGTMDLWHQHITSAGDPEGDPVAVTIGIGIQHAAFSRDGRKLVYSQGRPVANLWRVPIRQDRMVGWDDAEQLTFDQAYIEGVDVDPLERRLYFSSDRGGNQNLWALLIRSNDLTQLTTEPTPDRGPRVSPDGKRIAFYSYRGGNRDIWVVPSEGGPATQITDHPGSEMGPSWSPDGQHLAYYHADHAGGDSDGFVVPHTGGEPRRILNGPSRYLQWSPDGEWIGFLAGLSTRRFARVAASGGTPEELASDVGGFFRWSRDSRRIYFPRNRELWELTLADNRERPLTSLSQRAGGLVSYTLAVGTAHLYFGWSNDTGDIWVMDVVAPKR